MVSKEADEQVDQGPSEPAENGASEGAEFKATAPHRSRRAPIAIVLAAIAVLAIALLTKAPASAVRLPTSSATPGPSLAAAVTPATSTVDPTPADPPGLDPNATPYPAYSDVPVAAGTVRIVPAGPTPVRLSVTLPDGWERASESMYVKPSGTATVGLSIGAWSIAHVNEFPCRWASRRYSDEDAIGTAIGQAQALSDWWGQDPNLAPFFSNSTLAPIAIRPRPATIAGHDAMYVAVLIPSVFDFSQCDAGQLVLWETADGHVRYGLGPDEQHRLWVVDVNGQPIVIDASSPLSAVPADEAELQAVIDSIVIEP